MIIRVHHIYTHVLLAFVAYHLGSTDAFSSPTKFTSLLNAKYIRRYETHIYFDGPNTKSNLEVIEFDPQSSTNYQVDRVNGKIGNAHEDGGERNLPIWIARVILLLVAILWGTNFASVKYLETLCFNPPCNHTPSEAALARFGIATAAAIPFVINQRLEVVLAGLECGLWVGLGYFTQAVALSTISSAECAFICSLTVVVVPLISALLFGKKIEPIHIVSGIAAIIGVGVLEGMIDFSYLMNVQPALADVTTTLHSRGNSIDAVSATVASPTTLTAVSAVTNGSWLAQFTNALGVTEGDLIAFGQPIGFGISFMRIEHYLEKFKDTENRVITIAAAECIAVGFLSLLWVLNDFNGILPNFEYMIEPHRLGAILWTGVMTTGVAIYLEGFALQTLTATDAALTFASEPIWATLFGSWLLHESMNTNSYIGGTLILVACLLSATSDTSEVDN